MSYSTMKKIASVTVGSGGAANITFTDIPATFDDLKIVYSLRTNGGSGGGGNFHNDQVRFTLNSATTNYSQRELVALYDSLGTRVGSGSSTTENGLFKPIYVNNSGGTASTFSNTELYFSNYRSSANKSAMADSVEENNISTASFYGWFLQMYAGLWSDSAAISSISAIPATGTFVQHSTATLYGIRKS